MGLRSLASAISLLLPLGVAGCGGDDDKSLSTKDVFGRARPATVQILGRVGDSISGGTGVIIDSQKGLALTNHHVMAGLAAAKAKTFKDETVPVRVVGTAACEDIALVRMR